MSRIDFDEIARAALAHIDYWVETLLPGGKREGREYVVRNPKRPDRREGSFKVNLDTGKWGDFATGDKGGDMISLYAFLNDCSQKEAAEYIAKDENISMPEKKKQQKKGETWTPIVPVPDEAPVIPDKHFSLGEYSDSWPYFDADGGLMGHTCRFDKEDGDKEIWPLTFCKSSSGKREWRWKSFPVPRPLYGLDRLAENPDAFVVVVEGEKCADAGHELIGGKNIIVISWIGGAGQVESCDWSPLKGRKVVFWPDNDEDGRKAMQRAYAKVKDIVKDSRFLAVPEGKPKKWDIADAVKGGMGKEELIKFIQAHTVKPTLPAPEPERSTIPVNVFDNAPFRLLGYNHGVFYFLPRDFKQVVALTAKGMTKLGLIELAPIEYWEATFEQKKGVDWDYAANALMRTSSKIGVYDPKRLRGRGAWFDEGRVVLNLGDRLLCNGEEESLTKFKTTYIYEASITHGLNIGKPLNNERASELLKICDMLAWERPIYARFLAGWCMLASIGGALFWRPHIWITGQRGTGKSWVMNSIIRPIVGSFSLNIENNTTEAAIRQALGNDAIPVVYDEAEGENAHDVRRIQEVLKLARGSSTESEGAAIIKGGKNGDPMMYYVRSCFCLGSVNVNLQQAADLSRFTVLSMIKHDVMDREAKFREIEQLVGDTITREYCADLRARAIKLIPVIRENAKIFGRALAEKFHDQRTGDQLGALLAGAYALTSSTPVELEFAREWIESKDWSDQVAVESEADERRCLAEILEHRILINESSVSRVERSVIRLIAIAAEMDEDDDSGQDPVPPKDVKPEDANRVLLRHGIKVKPEDGWVYISASHRGIKDMLRGTAWEGAHKNVLKRIEGSTEKGTEQFETGIRHRAIGIPINYIFPSE